MTYDDFHKAKFESPGRCIYCASDGRRGGLHDEHIIAFALGGKTVIPKASCVQCEGVTHAFEGHLMHEYFDQIRWQHDLPSRRPRKDRPTALKAVVGKSEIETALLLDDHPSIAFALDLPNPGIFRGVKPSEVFPEVTLHAFTVVPDIKDRVSRLPDMSVTWKGKKPIGPFVRTLAKIGHCLAVGERGINGFKPYLCDFILKGTGPAAHYIGGTYGQGAPAPEPMLHRLGTELVEHEGIELVVARIRLFAYAGGLVYTVVVGETTNVVKRSGPTLPATATWQSS